MRRSLLFIVLTAFQVTSVPCSMFDIIKGAEWRLPSQCTSLTALSYPFGMPLGRYLASCVAKGVYLEELTVSGCDIRSNGASPICKALENHPRVTSLALGNNKIDAAGASAVASLLQNNNKIQHIDLGYNSLGNMGAHALAIAMTHVSLRSLILEGNHIGDDGVASLAAQLKGHFYFDTQFSSLRLGSNHITSTGAAAMASALAADPPLSLLDLGFNRLGSAGAVHVFTALQSNSHLRMLDLEHNSIIDSDDLRSVFVTSYSLTSLVLRSNALSGELVSLLLDTMQDLTSLDIGKCTLQDHDFRFFLPALQSHSALRRLYIDGLALTKESIDLLAQLTVKKSLDVISDYTNMLRDVVASIIEKEMVTNSSRNWASDEL